MQFNITEKEMLTMASTTVRGFAAQTVYVAYTCSKCGETVVTVDQILLDTDVPHEIPHEILNGYHSEKEIEEAKDRVNKQAETLLAAKTEKTFKEISEGKVPTFFTCSCPYCGHYEPWSYERKNRKGNIVAAIAGILVFGLVILSVVLLAGKLLLCSFACAASVVAVFYCLIHLSKHESKKTDAAIKKLPAESLPLIGRTVKELDNLMIKRYGFDHTKDIRSKTAAPATQAPHAAPAAQTAPDPAGTEGVPDTSPKTEPAEEERLDDYTFIRGFNEEYVGFWKQYDILIAAMPYSWEMMLIWADYMAEADLDYVAQVCTSGIIGAAEREITEEYREYGGKCTKMPSLKHEMGVLTMAGHSKALRTSIKIVWYNQSRHLRFFTLFDDEPLIRRYAESVIRRNFGTKDAMKLGKDLPPENTTKPKPAFSNNYRAAAAARPKTHPPVSVAKPKESTAQYFTAEEYFKEQARIAAEQREKNRQAFIVQMKDFLDSHGTEKTDVNGLLDYITKKTGAVFDRWATWAAQRDRIKCHYEWGGHSFFDDGGGFEGCLDWSITFLNSDSDYSIQNDKLNDLEHFKMPRDRAVSDVFYCKDPFGLNGIYEIRFEAIVNTTD